MKIDTNGFELEDKVRDTVTGFEGKIVGMTQWTTGCARAAVQPMWDAEKGGKIPETYSVDVLTLELIEAGPRSVAKAERKAQREFQTGPEARAASDALVAAAPQRGARLGGPATLIERGDR